MFKRNSFKKFLFLILTLMVVNSNICIASNSEEDNLAIEKVNVLDIMVGTDNGFEEEATLTRAQAAAIVVRLKGFSENDIKSKATTAASAFSDVEKDHWAVNYINVASLYNLINGTGEGKFEPNNKVKIIELCAMVSRVLGAGNMINSEGIWPDNYINFSTREGLLKGVNSKTDKEATRLETAKILANALELNTWKNTTISTNGKAKYEREKEKKLLDTFKIKKYNGEVIENIDTKNKKVTFEEYDDKENDLNDLNFKSSINLKGLEEGMKVEVWVNTKKDEIIMIKEDNKKLNDVQTTVNFSSVKSINLKSDKLTLIVEGTNYVYYFAESVTDSEYRGTYNGTKKTLDEIYTLLEKEDKNNTLSQNVGKVTIYDSKVIWIDFYKYDSIGIVEEVDEDAIYFYDSDEVEGSNIDDSIDATSENSYVVNLKGKEISFDGISEGYILKYYYDEEDDKYYIVAYSKNVVGEVTDESSKYIYVDDKKYLYASNVDLIAPDEGDEIKIYLNENDEIIMYALDEDLIWLVEDEEINYTDDDDEEKKLKPVSDSNITTGFISSAEGTTVNRKKVLRIGITNLNGNEVIRYVNLDKMLTLFEGKFDDKSILQEEIIDLYLGTFVKYRVESSKYVLYQFGPYVYKGLTQNIIYNKNAKLVKSNDKMGSYSYNDDTKFYITSIYSESDYKKTASFEEISIEQLENSVKYDFSGADLVKSKLSHIVVKADEDDLEDIEGVGVLLSTSKDGDDTLFNIATSVGTRKYKIKTSDIKDSKIIVGSLIEYTIKGTRITKYRLTNPQLSEFSEDDEDTEDVLLIKAKIINIYEDAINLRLPSEEKVLYYAKNIAYVDGSITDTKNEFALKSLKGTTTKPTTISSSTKFGSSQGQVVYCYMVKEDEDFVVRAIVY